MILKRDDSVIATTNPVCVSSPHGVRPTDGRSLVLSGARIFGLFLAVCILAGCSTAPSWPTARECEQRQQEIQNPCASTPSWQIARDFTALTNVAVANGAQFSDISGLRRLKPADPRPTYRLGPLDELSITVWGAKEIWSEITDQSQQPTRVTSVQEDGAIVLPLLTNVRVDGLTLSEALAKIANSYRQVLGTSFQVDGQITKFRSKPVLLDGAITKPGTVYLSTEVRTLGEAIGIGGGGFPETAELSKGLLIRGPQRYSIDFQGAQSGANDQHNIELQPGDRIYFPSRETGFFYVLGEVLVPGAFSIPPKGINLMQGLAMAKGPIMQSGNMESIFLVRVNEKEPRIYHLTLGEIMASRDLPIVPGDRIFVPATSITSWERTLRGLIPFLSTGVLVHGAFGVNLP